MIETETKAPPPAPPGETAVAASAAEPQTICPESGRPCEKGCTLPLNTGSTYCEKWVRRQRGME